MVDPWVGAGWSRLSSEIVFSSTWMEVRRDEAVRPDGSHGIYDHVVVPGSVTVLAVDGQQRVAVTRQWIYVHGQSQWRLPAGRIDEADGAPAAAAQRELAEETGISATRWTPLGTINCADSLTNHREHAFHATGLTIDQPRLEAGEADLELHWRPFIQVVDMVIGGEMPHAGSAFAVLMAHVRGLI